VGMENHTRRSPTTLFAGCPGPDITQIGRTLITYPFAPGHRAAQESAVSRSGASRTAILSPEIRKVAAVVWRMRLPPLRAPARGKARMYLA